VARIDAHFWSQSGDKIGISGSAFDLRLGPGTGTDDAITGNPGKR